MSPSIEFQIGVLSHTRADASIISYNRIRKIGLLPQQQCPGAGKEVVARIFGIHAALDGMALWHDLIKLQIVKDRSAYDDNC
jgi:hypothetical protein